MTAEKDISAQTQAEEAFSLLRDVLTALRGRLHKRFKTLRAWCDHYANAEEAHIRREVETTRAILDLLGED